MGSPGPRTIAKDWLGLDESGTFELTGLGAALPINIGSYVFLWARIVRMKACPANLVTAVRSTVTPEVEALVGNAIERILADTGYRGHNGPPYYNCSRQIRSAG